MVEDAQGAPPRPWVTGSHKTHTVFRLIVTVCETVRGWTFSEHEFASRADELLASAIPSGGTRQIAHALFQEALIRELFLEALMLQQEHPGYLRAFKDADEQGRTVIADRLADAAALVFTKLVFKVGKGTARGVLEMMAGSLVQPPPPPEGTGVSGKASDPPR